jgi:hypothetical protein
MMLSYYDRGFYRVTRKSCASTVGFLETLAMVFKNFNTM